MKTVDHLPINLDDMDSVMLSVDEIEDNELMKINDSNTAGDEEVIDFDDAEENDDGQQQLTSISAISTDTTSVSNVSTCEDISNTLDPTESWQGFKLVGDNVDKNIKHSFDRVDTHTLSLHYYHCFAVQDRLDLSGFSDQSRSGVIEMETLLPSPDDIVLMKKHFSILISRMLVKELPEYMNDAENVKWHIDHERDDFEI
jgi:L1 cell adhesion molecule like protein